MVERRSGAPIGRDDELRLARRLLEDGARLITVVGAPGVGKTRVLRHVARDLADEGADVCVVALRDLAASGVLGGVLRALGGAARVSSRASAIARAAERMERRGTVLVLDEAEHVRDEVAELVTAWLDGTTRVRVLASSRERLDVVFEHVVRLEPLAPAFAAALLRDALGRAAARWKVSDDDARRLVSRVDGLPLGVELLASRVAALGPHSVLASRALPRLRAFPRASRSVRRRDRLRPARAGLGGGGRRPPRRCVGGVVRVLRAKAARRPRRRRAGRAEGACVRPRSA